MSSTVQTGRTCQKCGLAQPLDAFRVKGGRMTARCRTCLNADDKRYKELLRADILARYGRVCACCGETEILFLAIDHTDGNGNAHRRANNTSSGTKMLQWLKRNGYPVGFRVLCHNCNAARGFYGYCPHETVVVVAAPMVEATTA